MKFEKKFYTRFGPGEITFPMKVEDWAIRRDDWLGKIVLIFVVPWLKELWIEVKVKETMNDVDRQTAKLVNVWDEDEKWMMDPKFTETVDETNPFGVSELRIQSPWVEDSEEET